MPELKFKFRQRIGGVKPSFLLLLLTNQVYHFDQIGSKIATQEGEVKGVSTAIASVKSTLVKATAPLWEKLSVVGLGIVTLLIILIWMFFYFRNRHEKDKWGKLEAGEHPKHEYFAEIGIQLWLLKHLPLTMQPKSVRQHPHQLFTLHDNILILIFHPFFKALRHAVMIWLIFTITFSSVGIYFLQHAGKALAVNWLSGWDYRKPITISNTDSALTNYQVSVTLDTASLIIAGKMKTDCGDIRFTDSDATTTLNYWLESGCNSTSTKLWVKVPSVPSGSKTIYVYYGNSSATSASSAANTFIREIDGAQPVKGSWHLDEGTGTIAGDTSGQGNNGTIYGATWTSGKFKNALSFNGTSDYIQTTSTTNIPSGQAARTISAWIKPTNSNPGGIIVALNNSSGQAQSFIVEMTTYGSTTYLFTDGINAKNNIAISGSEIPVANQWHHIAFTFDGSNSWAYYLDGEQKKTGTFLTTINTVLNNVEIGRRGDGAHTGSFWPGSIDEVRIYNRVLTDAEISDLYNNYGYTTTNYPGRVLVRKFVSPEPTTSVGAEEISNQPPNTPTNSSPTNGATGQNLNLTLTGSAYSDPENNPQTDAEWQIDDDPDFATPVWTRTAGAAETSTQVATSTGTFANELAGKTELDHNTTYYWQVRYSDGKEWSNWSASTTFSTNLVNTPTNLSPANGATVTTLSPLLTASAFSDDQTGHTHAASQWLIDDNSDFSSPTYDSGETASAETSRAIPGGALTNYQTYYWKVRYKDSSGLWSSYSTSTRFSIQIPETAIEVRPVFGNTTVDQGDTVKIDVQVINFADGSPLNDATSTINIYNPSGTKIVDGATMTYVSGSNGIYRYSYTVPAVSGSYLYEVTATKGAKSGYGASNFEVRTIASDISSAKSTVESEQTAQTAERAAQSAERTAQATSRTRVEDIQTKVTTMQSDVSTIKSDVSSIKSDVSSAKSTIDSVWSRLQTLTGTLPSGYTGVYEQLVSIANTLAGLGVLKGQGAESLYSLSAASKDDVKYLKNKILDLQAAIEINKILLISGGQNSVFSTWYTFHSVVLNMLIANPTNRKTKIPFKTYLPKETKQEHIISSGGLKVEYDERAEAYAVSGEFELEGGESITRKVEIKDIWLIDEKELEELKRQGEEMGKVAKKTAYSGQVTVLKNDTFMRIERIARKQKEASATPQDHILAYRENIEDLAVVKENLKKMTDLVTSAGAGQGLLGSIAGINTLMAWGVIIAIVTGVILLGLTFYSMWKYQMIIVAQLAGKKTGGKAMETEAVETDVPTLSSLLKINWGIILPRLKKIFLILVVCGVIFGVIKGVIYLKPWEKLRKQEQPAVMVPVESEKGASPSLSPTLTPAPKKVVILKTETGWLNVRGGPGISFDIVTRVDVGEEFIELDRKVNGAGEEWIKIQVDEKTKGWVLGKYVEEK